MKTRLLAVGLVLALVAAACGSRASRQEVQSADANSGLSGNAQNSTGGPAAGPGGTSQPGMFGTLPSPCGPGDASGATDVGVTDTEIKVVTIADPGGAKPGLNQGVFDSMKAFEKWCNEQGGINGRKLKVELRDAKLSEYQAQVKYGCENALALVGSMGVLDQTGAQDQVDCGLPNVAAAAVSPEQTGADFTFQPLPNPVDSYLVGPAQWVARTYPDVIKNAAALRTKLSITEIQSNRLIEAYKTVGFNFTYVDSANIGETNWAPLVLSMKNQGVTYMTLTSSFEEIIPLQRTMDQQGLHPVVELEANFYNLKYPQQAGSVADGTFVRLTTWPFEEADQNPAMAEYLRALKAAVPNAEPELLGVQAWSAALLWATAVKELGSDVTRAGLIEKLSQIHQWDGGGLHGTSDPGANKPAPCYIIMKVEGGGFVRQYPKPDTDAAVYDRGHGFDCSPSNIVALTGNYGSGAKAER
ncbi:ABC transporter substrate-binding protein [Rhabdothermincola sp.]|uniref:ABC transporter substrate-binding protein n=1 Tax=Rhabdothermincola sp. TaxID=2820405 RepID=UPI002FE26E56